MLIICLGPVFQAPRPILLARKCLNVTYLGGRLSGLQVPAAFCLSHGKGRQLVGGALHSFLPAQGDR